ncbi:unnamed protein product [Candidula unifasciata]|uniref:Uncharacterized protein n=1 Tax=Candidula unifasciata TaxID=100452 RepID=A0A8S3YYP3_9EUPU|nr:unnamed protein product [Candidula unifasciata]
MAVSLLYFLLVTILPQNYPNEPAVVTKIATALNDSTADGNVLFKFTVAGEASVIVIVRVRSNAALDRITSRLRCTGYLEIRSQPIITYESHARNLNVSADLTGPYEGTLQPENIYWFNLRVDYNNKTTEELLDIWKTEAESFLGSRKSGSVRAVAFKNLGEREVQLFINAPQPDQFDLLLFNTPIVQAIGSDIRAMSKGVLFLN